MTAEALIPRSIDGIDWATWTPRDRATLVFVIQGDRMLLIRKKRGLGAGKINGPGGRLEPDELPEACAIRETREELHITVTDLTLAGELRFQFLGGYSTHVYVFATSECTGEPTETDEAAPLWVPLEAIPYDEMWADDRLWIPHMLAGRPFDGRFVFDDDVMLDQVVVVGMG